MVDALSQLTIFISDGLKEEDRTAREILQNLFGGRYHKRHFSKSIVRDALKLGLAAQLFCPVPHHYSVSGS